MNLGFYAALDPLECEIGDLKNWNRFQTTQHVDESIIEVANCPFVAEVGF